MTEQLVRAIGEEGEAAKSKTLNLVCGALLAYDSARGSSPYTGLDVERVFAAVELLAERETLEVTPFVANWHPAVDVWDQPDLPNSFDRDLQKQMFEERPPFNRARDLVVGLVKTLTGGGSGAVYRELAIRMVRELHRLVNVSDEPAAVEYLRPLVRQAHEHGGFAIATLNYDRSIELAGDAEGIRVSTGIENWADHRSWDWPSEGVRLMKLHGSIDWKWTGPKQMAGQFPSVTIEQVNKDGLRAIQTANANVWDPVLVFGQRGKLRASGPFLSLLAQFEEQLGRAEALTVVGYSFRDEHVNEIIRQWTAEDVSRTITVVDPSFPTRFRWDDAAFRAQLIDYLNPRFSPREDKEAVERVTVVRKIASEALLELFP